jgi:putative ABC transport system ATP-binding protein
MIEVKDLKFSYGKGEKVFFLAVSSFKIEPRETVFLQGPSGCGKSTFLELLSGVLCPSSGKIFFEGVDIANLPEKSRDQIRGTRMGFIFQSFNLMPYLTVMENLTLSMRLQGKTAEAVLRAEAALSALGLMDRRRHFAHELSVGQQQRVAIARSLLHEPRLVLADEPTSALDEQNSELALDYLFSEVKRIGASLILVSHDSSLAPRFDRALQASDFFGSQNHRARPSSGSIVSDGSSETSESRGKL